MINKNADFKIRLIASMLDSMIWLLVFAGLLHYVVTQSTFSAALSAFVLSLIILLNPVVVFSSVLFTHYFGGSLGKLLTGLRIVGENNKPLSFKRILFRQTAGYTFSWTFFGLGFLSVIKDEKKQAWHDKAVGSYVKADGNLFLFGVVLFIISLIAVSMLFLNSLAILSEGALLGEFEQTEKNLSLIPSVLEDLRS